MDLFYYVCEYFDFDVDPIVRIRAKFKILNYVVCPIALLIYFQVIGGKKDKEQEITKIEEKFVEIFSYYLILLKILKKILKKNVS